MAATWSGDWRKKAIGFAESTSSSTNTGKQRATSSWSATLGTGERCRSVDGIDEVYQLAADMGGAGYIFTGEHDADVMQNSATINLNILEFGSKAGVKDSSIPPPPASIRNTTRRTLTTPSAPRSPPIRPRRTVNMVGRNSSASGSIWPTCGTMASRFALPVFTTSSARKGHGLAGERRRRRPFAAKLPRLRMVASIEIWGDGKQTRSFLYIDECLEGVWRLMKSGFTGPVNIGSEEMVTINGLAEMAIEIARKKLILHHIPGPLGVRGRNSDNRLIAAKLGWAPSSSLREGLGITYRWVEQQVLAEQMKSAVPMSR